RTGFDTWAEDYRHRLDHETISEQQRTQAMLARNPKYILRNYMAQIAIEKAENGDFSEVNRLLHILQNPFDEHPEAEEYAGLPPDWSESLSVSCSS
ncbi:protein adenylyltransferase SelO family protein, partial [Porticoccaceae bacterium]|nr:protein adenylyltransferase SelO family protein [Porticoccaceae bacterium]